MGFRATDIESVLDSYSAYLRYGHPQNVKRFDETRSCDWEGAVAEAIVFGMLQQLDVGPRLNESVETGGADFICCRSRGPVFNGSVEDRFVVEATSLSPDAVASRSQIPNAVPERVSGGAFGLVTRNILNKAKDKATQLCGYEMPRVLAICSCHAGVSALFNGTTATWALVSEPHWEQEFGSTAIDTAQYTDLENSVFIKPGPKGSIVACRKSISGILLVAVHGDRSQVWGILHPEPAYAMSAALLPNVPFVRILEWPVADGRISTEWIGGDTTGHSVYHSPVRLPTLSG